MTVLLQRQRLTSEELRARMRDRAERVAKLSQGNIRQRVVVACPQGGFITELREVSGVEVR